MLELQHISYDVEQGGEDITQLSVFDEPEAGIGKIAGEQLTKLMTLGLTEKEAEEQTVNGFLK